MIYLKQTKYLILISGIFLLCFCNINTNIHSTAYLKTASGLQYKITKKNRGLKPVKGDNLVIHYVGKLNNDSVFDNIYEQNKTISIIIGNNQVISGLEEGLLLMKQGEKASFIIPSELAYGDKKTGIVPANSILRFDVELVKVKKNRPIEPFYIEGKQLNETPSGLKYVIVKSTSGIKPLRGAKVTVNYSGYLETGFMFDSSIQNGVPFSFFIGDGRVIKGWDEGLAMMRVGEKYRFIIPYNLGYGEDGIPSIIPPKSNLIFDIELLSIEL